MGDKMNKRTITELFELCKQPDTDLAEIENFIISSNATPEEITYTAIRFTNFKFTEQLNYTIEGDSPYKEIVETNFIRLFEVFIKYGLLPNLIYTTDNINYHNIMQEIRYINNGDTAPIIMRKLMECGGDPNLDIDGCSLFSELDFDIIFDVVELDNKPIFDIEFKIWLVMMGYGGYIKEHKRPVKMKEGHSPEIFKNFEDFDYKIEFKSKDWIMHIFNKYSGIEVASL